MAKPRVSVVIPAFNAQQFIGAALGSALSQTHSELEVIAVDDASSDGTAEEVRRFAEADARVRLIRHACRRGASAARNTAIDAASGTWVAPLDADDTYGPRRIEYLLDGAHQSGADLVADNLMTCSFPERIPLEPALRPGSALFHGPVTLSLFLQHECENDGITLGHLKPMIRRRFLGQNGIRYREDLAVAEDFGLYVDCLFHGARAVLLPEPHYLYSIRPGSLTNRRSLRSMLDIARLNREILASPPIQANPEWIRYCRIRQQHIDRTIVAASFAAALKARQLRRALDILRRNPNDVGACVNRLAAAVARYWRGEPYRPRGMKG